MLIPFFFSVYAGVSICKKAWACRARMCRNFSPQPSAGPPAGHWDDYSARLLCQITVTPRTRPDGHTHKYIHYTHSHINIHIRIRTHKHLPSNFRTVSCNHCCLCWLYTHCIQYIVANIPSSVTNTCVWAKGSKWAVLTVRQGVMLVGQLS